MKFFLICFFSLLLMACQGNSSDNEPKQETETNSPPTVNTSPVSSSLKLSTNESTSFKGTLVSADDPSSNVRFLSLEQPKRGQLWVEEDQRTFHYDPIGALDYLDLSESYKETVNYKATNGDEEWTGELSITVDGLDNPDECSNIPTTTIDSSWWPIQTVDAGNCVTLDTGSLSSSKPAKWVVWTGKNGAANTTLLPYIGVDDSDPNLTFLPPSAGHYSLSWCPLDNSECIGSWRFEVQGEPTPAPTVKISGEFYPQTNTSLELKAINVISPDERPLTYRWLVFDSTNEQNATLVMDLTSKESSMNFFTGQTNRNLEAVVLVANDRFSIENTGFYSSVGGGFSYHIPRGLYGWNYQDVYVRDPNGPSPPKAVLAIDAVISDHQITKNEGQDIYHSIKVPAGESLVFDGSASSDPDGDTLAFSWVIYQIGSYQVKATSFRRKAHLYSRT